MAADAVTRDVYMVEIRWAPGDRGVTVVASIVAGNVSRMFAGRHDAVMTGTANTNYLRMVDSKNRHEYIGVMAVLADIAGLDVCRTLANCLDPIVAVDTIAGDVHVIEVRRQPAKSRMAVVTGIAAR